MNSFHQRILSFLKWLWSITCTLSNSVCLEKKIIIVTLLYCINCIKQQQSHFCHKHRLVSLSLYYLPRYCFIIYVECVKIRFFVVVAVEFLFFFNAKMMKT